jgi:beta-lactamase superfamily II metal-dependent hydrolase
MELIEGKWYFVAERDVVLREKANGNARAENHLLFGDWLTYLGETKNGWARVRSRNCNGWLPISSFGEERPLEVNFVDIGQGDGCHIVTPDDKVILIDAGEGDNMHRFISWRYNLRRRELEEDGGPPPFPIDHAFISHPDKDHYYGFGPLFENRKLRFRRVYHNGIVERPIPGADRDPELWYPSGEDLGGYLREDGESHLWDVVNSNSAMHELIDRHRGTRKMYLSTLVKAVENNPDVDFIRVCSDDDYIEGFGADQPIALKVLGPMTERRSRGNRHRGTLVRLGDEGVTKNGHSIILQLRIGKLSLMLGGDLNTESEDYLFRRYCDARTDVSWLEKRIHELERLGASADADERQELAELTSELETIVTRARGHFQVDVTKACHHGSHHFSESFIRSLNAIATVISSGDAENYAHPRPDALGAFGKYSRGLRPLIFSTELARNTREFTPVIKYIDRLRRYEAELAAADSNAERARIRKKMNEARDRNVAVYGMITLRTDGETVVIAQKLEEPGGNDNKWDIHELEFNEHTGSLEYHPSAKGH